jgi:hypothetical protein
MIVSKFVTRFVITATCLAAVAPLLLATSANAAPPTAASPAPKTAKKHAGTAKVKTAARKTGGALATASRKTQGGVETAGRKVEGAFHKKSAKKTTTATAPKVTTKKP